MTIINNALSGALASQVALSATSQNIANLQTKGYTRQGALLTAVGPNAGAQSAGNGVAASSLLRFSDGYKTQQLWRSAADLGAHTQTQPYLTQLEQVMGDDKASLSGGVDAFFSALNAVAGEDPTSTPLRQQVLTGANLLAQRFNNLSNVYKNQLQSIRQQRSAIIESANSTIANIATLNRQIMQASASGNNTSSLIDARDQAIDSLASQMALEVADQPDGSRNVSLKSGQALVLSGVCAQLSVSGGANQSFGLQLAGANFQLDASALGGKLGGLSAYQRNILVPLQQGVSDMAEQIADLMNRQLAQGYKMNGSAGTPMFEFNADNGSSLLRVVDGFQTADLAFSSDKSPGDSGNLQKMIALKNQPIVVSTIGSVLISDADTQLTGKLGVDSQQNQAALSTAQTVRDQAQTDWLSTSGVNQDEEASNLIEFQNMYQANMKVIAVANTLFDATLAMMG